MSLRLFLDSNVLISGLIKKSSKGISSKLVDKIIEEFSTKPRNARTFSLILTDNILHEVMKFLSKYEELHPQLVSIVKLILQAIYEQAYKPLKKKIEEYEEYVKRVLQYNCKQLNKKKHVNLMKPTYHY